MPYFCTVLITKCILNDYDDMTTPFDSVLCDSTPHDEKAKRGCDDYDFIERENSERSLTVSFFFFFLNLYVFFSPVRGMGNDHGWMDGWGPRVSHEPGPGQNKPNQYILFFFKTFFPSSLLFPLVVLFCGFFFLLRHVTKNGPFMKLRSGWVRFGVGRRGGSVRGRGRGCVRERERGRERERKREG